ncbi:hypothetical protein V1954_21285 [Yersinia sp. 2538 StPb PI]|uniref:hypothetical protein n=1 Tax=Yersinia sp. 2538 StPb PI TaxID=3117405 RepID=UPI003FA43AAB
MNNTSQYILSANSVEKGAESQLPNNINYNNRHKSPQSLLRKVKYVVMSMINAYFILIMTLFNIVGWLAVAIPVIAFWVFVSCYDNSVVINREFITNLVHLSFFISVLVLSAYIALVSGFKRKVPFVHY